MSRVDRQRGLVVVTLILGLDQVVKAAVAASNGVERGFSPDRAFVPVVLLVVVAGVFVELTRRRLVGVAAVGLVAGGLASSICLRHRNARSCPPASRSPKSRAQFEVGCPPGVVAVRR
ncbi:MAG: hypothetical protein OEW91_06480 [Acidimicrobiia bacterium]|nr:hypothetical protein [Acidimicrobiia bacterium]